jgi:hypothetical protein
MNDSALVHGHLAWLQYHIQRQRFINVHYQSFAASVQEMRIVADIVMIQRAQLM